MSEDEIVPLLDEENFEQDRSQFVDVINSCHQSTIKPQRSLPPGKTYHIFISYSSHDQPYVLRLKYVLERLGFKCMLADHDFSYGVSVMRNIETTIQTCHKLLLVVSQHFLKSAMCEKEVDMAHKYAADIGRNDFMIVLRLDESKMPLRLDFMTYINGAELEVNVVGLKVEKAFDGLADVPVQQNINGLEILRKQPTPKSGGVCCSSSYELTDLSKFDRDTLMSWTVEGSQTCYRKIMEAANDHFLLKRYGVFVCGCKLYFCGILLALGNVTLILSMYVLLTILTGANTSSGYSVLIAFGIAGLTIGLHTACTMRLFTQVMRRLSSIVRKNTDCRSQNYILIPRRQRNAFFISIIYYDMKPCWNYLEKRARECWPHDSEESIAEKCQEELLTTILGSFTGFDLDLIPPAASIRHNTYQNRCCLCQLAKSPWTNRNLVLNPIPKHEINQTDETCVMKIAESETKQETLVKGAFEIDHEYFASTKENDETCVLKILSNGQESYSPDTPDAEAVIGSPLTEIGSGQLSTGAEGGTSLRRAEGVASLRRAEGGTSLRAAEGGRLISPRGGEGGISLRGSEGAVCGSLLDHNIDQWYGDMCETHVRGEATNQRQVAHELITLEKHPTTLMDSEMSTSLNDVGEAASLRSGEQEMQCFRGEYCIDEATHAKVPV